jgi:hypothetical protein
MNLQDPKPPREALEKLVLESATLMSGDITVLDTLYETSNEACLRLLHQNDDLEAENKHLHQKLNQSPNTQQIQVEHTHLWVAKTWLIVPIGLSTSFNWLPRSSQRRTRQLKNHGSVRILPKHIMGLFHAIAGNAF